MTCAKYQSGEIDRTGAIRCGEAARHEKDDRRLTRRLAVIMHRIWVGPQRHESVAITDDRKLELHRVVE